MLALTDVLIDPVHTLAPILTRIAVALIKLVFTAIACISGITITSVASNAIYASTMVAWVRLTVVDINFTESPFITYKGKMHTISIR